MINISIKSIFVGKRFTDKILSSNFGPAECSTFDIRPTKNFGLKSSFNPCGSNAAYLNPCGLSFTFRPNPTQSLWRLLMGAKKILIPSLIRHMP